MVAITGAVLLVTALPVQRHDRVQSPTACVGVLLGAALVRPADGPPRVGDGGRRARLAGRTPIALRELAATQT